MQEVKYKLVPVEPTDEMLAAAWDIDVECHNHHGPADVSYLGEIKAKEVWSTMLAEAPEQLSDLEIVQKALSKAHASLSETSGGGWSVYSWWPYDGVNGAYTKLIFRGASTEDLLAWAKQTIGIDSW